MKKLFILLLLAALTTCSRYGGNCEKYIWDTVYGIVRSCRTGASVYKAEKTIHYANKYRHDPVFFAKLIKAESSYVKYRHNTNSGAVGLMQIVTNIHNLKEPFDIDNNLDYGAKLLRKYCHIDGSYRTAVITFGGYRGKWSYRVKQRDEYLSKIFD